MSKRPVSCPECEEVVTNVVNNYVDNVVYFRINSAKIDKNQQVSIFNTAQFMKDNNVPIKVIGYADKKTGTGSYNMQLSEKRARAVAKELIDKYGISSTRSQSNGRALTFNRTMKTIGTALLSCLQIINFNYIPKGCT